MTLVNFSTDYVFDGTQPEHGEDEPFSPLGVYGQTKAAGDALVAAWARHYTIRTSWVVGEGKNFVSVMSALARSGAQPTVVNDQFGRLTFAEDLAAGVVHLLQEVAPYGTYNLTSGGPVQSWADIAADVFELCGRPRSDVRPVSTQEYSTGGSPAPRPRHSALDQSKLAATGFVGSDRQALLKHYANA